MSTDPSPWSEGHEEDILEPTDVMVAREQQERIEEERQRYADAKLWERYAGRMTLDGSLIR